MSCEPLPYVAALHPYMPGKSEDELKRELGLSQVIKLASNESPLAPRPRILSAIWEAANTLHRYPDGSSHKLTAMLAERSNVQPGQITIGNGSNDVLDMIARAYLGPGRNAVFAEHAFAVYPLSTQMVGAEAKVVPAINYGHDLDGMLAAIDENTKVVFVANPNNPVGDYIPSDTLLSFLQKVPSNVVVVVDQAYFELIGEEDYPDATQWLGQFDNLVVTRTFSKAYGIPGTRVGYGVSSEEVAQMLNRVRHPFNVNSLAQAAAIAALELDHQLQLMIANNVAGLEQLHAGLKAQGLTALPSCGNFITFDLGREGMPVFEGLLRKGVIVRPVANYGLPNALRVSVGLPDENAAFLEALKEVLGE